MTLKVKNHVQKVSNILNIQYISLVRLHILIFCHQMQPQITFSLGILSKYKSQRDNKMHNVILSSSDKTPHQVTPYVQSMRRHVFGIRCREIVCNSVLIQYVGI